MLTETAEIVPGRFRRLWADVHRRIATRRATVWLLATIAAVALLIPTLARLNLATFLAAVRAANPWWLLVALAANFAILPLMTLQWQLLLPRARAARWRELWPCVAIGMAGMNTLPAAGGHAIATGLLASRGITTVAGGVLLLTLEQVCEAIAKFGLVAFVVALVPMPAPLWRAVWITGALTLFLVTSVGWLTWRRERHGESRRWWHAWAAHLQSVRDPRRFSAACGFSLLMKVTAWIAIEAVQRSIGVHLPTGETALVLAAVTFATMVSIAPGNIGLFELGAVGSYQLAGVAAPQAAVLAILVHVAFLLPILGTGCATLVFRAVVATRGAVAMRRRPGEL